MSLTLLLLHLNFVSTFSQNTLSKTTFQFKGRSWRKYFPFTKMRDNESQEELEKDTAGPTLFLHPQCTNSQKKLSYTGCKQNNWSNSYYSIHWTNILFAPCNGKKNAFSCLKLFQNIGFAGIRTQDLMLNTNETFLGKLVHCFAEQQQQKTHFYVRFWRRSNRKKKKRKHHHFEIIVIFVVRGSLCIVNIP